MNVYKPDTKRRSNECLAGFEEDEELIALDDLNARLGYK